MHQFVTVYNQTPDPNPDKVNAPNNDTSYRYEFMHGDTEHIVDPYHPPTDDQTGMFCVTVNIS